MAKLLGPDFISLQVRNLSASRAFYTEVLGLTEDTSFSAPNTVLFDSTTIPFALSEAKGNLDEAPHPAGLMRSEKERETRPPKQLEDECCCSACEPQWWKSQHDG